VTFEINTIRESNARESLVATNAFANLIDYLRARPILCLLLLTPGIPEYLSGSSPVNDIVLNPFQFVFQVIANLGLYGPGVLLIREAFVRWKKGWATVLILGAAYGILEEGVGLSTLYNPLANPVGKLGFYGHYFGVNWVWVAGILPVHMIFSISLPILLLGLAIPETNGKSLITSRKRIAATFAILTIDVAILFTLILLGEHFWMGWPVFVGSFVTIGCLVLIAKRVPSDLLHARNDLPTISCFKIGILGALYYTSVVLAELFIGVGLGSPPALDVLLVVGVQALFLFFFLRVIGNKNNERQLLVLAVGLVLPIEVFGVISQINLPLVFAIDLLFTIFIWTLFQKYGKDTTKVDRVEASSKMGSARNG
jgi:hypothetical protein